VQSTKFEKQATLCYSISHPSIMWPYGLDLKKTGPVVTRVTRNLHINCAFSGAFCGGVRGHMTYRQVKQSEARSHLHGVATRRGELPVSIQ